MLRRPPPLVAATHRNKLVRAKNTDPSPAGPSPASDKATVGADSQFEADSKGRLPFFQEAKVWARDIFFAALTAILIVVFVVQPVKVEGTSMQPRLFDHERIFVNKFVYHFAEIDRGDIVVFWFPREPNKSLIKRVVGLPGDRLEIHSGKVFVNERQLDEAYVRSQYFDNRSYGPVDVPENQYFVMGDHRSSSNDSRHWGGVPRENIFGRAVFRYWPVSRMGLID